ncbi:PREDICTED: uncharacterized protein LOC109128745 [Camelina sativa]|uniref:Uncharacterized protein LOC109128745 n=1 Tax=Camelina sativa TaxID=90675 RepID=A0ABM1QWM6_CAMSA|nr:PREDICTED: uncharacterized protein LOC109128745 [Camelina sativa]
MFDNDYEAGLLNRRRYTQILEGLGLLYVCQRKYALDIVIECGLTGCCPYDTPLEQNHNLARDNGPLFDNPSRYCRLVGRLVYLSVTRPDLSYAVHLLAQFLAKPRERHWTAAVRVVKYLKGTLGQGIFLSSDKDLHVNAYCDAAYSTCPLTRRSITGYVVLLGDSPVSWKTKKHKTVSRSSTQAEYRAMSFTYSEIQWLMELLPVFDIVHKEPVSFYCDNESAIKILKNPVFHERTKHIKNDCHIIRDAFQSSELTLVSVSTKEQVADFLTKALGRIQFIYLLGKMGVRDIYSPS